MSGPQTALTIGGSDPSGSGGIQGDLKVFTSYAVYGMSVITALTCQNSVGVSEVIRTPASLVAGQFKSIYNDIDINAIKIGMLASSENLIVVSQLLEELNMKNIVLDPVFLSSSGTPLLQRDSIRVMVELLLPLADIITPNLHEASTLAGMKVDDITAMQNAAQVIKNLGPRYVLIKGGHLEGRAIDLLYDGEKFETLEAPKVGKKEFRGTGCALSAAIAAGLASGYRMEEAVRRAKNFVTRAITAGFEDLGKGMAILNHNLPVNREG